MKLNIIYALLDPTTKEVRYIGKSTSGLTRPKDHLKPFKYNKENNYKAKWVRSLIKQGLKPEISVLAEYDTAEELFDAEIAFIKQYREQGANLTNLTDGGEGSIGRVNTEETKKKMSETMKKVYAPLVGTLKAPNKKEHIIIEGIAHKQCNDCKQTLPLSEYGLVSRNWDGLNKYCKTCWAKRTQDYRDRNPATKLSEEELKQSYQDRKAAVSKGVKERFEKDPMYRLKISARRSKAIEGTCVLTGKKIYFNSAIEAKQEGFSNSNIGQAIKHNKPYKGYIWKFIY